MTFEEALNKHKQDCKKCNYKVCKMEDNANECLQDMDIKTYEFLNQVKDIIVEADKFYEDNKLYISTDAIILMNSIKNIKQLMSQLELK